MPRRWPAAALLAACTALTGCSGGSAEPAPTVTVTETAAPEGAPDAAPEGQASQACRDALDLGSSVIGQSNQLIEQFARAVQGDQAAVDALSDAAANQAIVQRLAADQQQYIVLSAECRGEEPPAP